VVCPFFSSFHKRASDSQRSLNLPKIAIVSAKPARMSRRNFILQCPDLSERLPLDGNAKALEYVRRDLLGRPIAQGMEKGRRHPG
jgi:hypothetical protein